VRTALLDGDTLIYQAAAANEYEAQWSEWMWTLHARLDAAIEQLDDTIKGIVEGLQAGAVVVALSDKENWRKRVMPSYKSNRASKRKPVIYEPLREYVGGKYKTYVKDGLEGDDVLGILATHPLLIKGEKIVVSIDKDMATIPGLHLNDKKAREQMTEGQTYADFIRTVTPEEADRFHLIQTLAGDATDGYPGCPGIGVVRAAALLDEGKVLEPREHVMSRGPRKGEKEIRWEPGREGTPWEIVVSAYASQGLSEEVALTSARVARIARGRDYSFKKGEIELWQPQRSAASK
jgi:5'-3' exonuclease